MKTAEEWSKELGVLCKGNSSGAEWEEPRLHIDEVEAIQLDARAELEQQNQMLREALDKCLLRLRALGTCAMSDREWEYLNKTIIDCESALSTPPPTQQWVRKEVADNIYTNLSNLYQNGDLTVSYDWMDDINKALTAYERETSETKEGNK